MNMKLRLRYKQMGLTPPPSTPRPHRRHSTGESQSEEKRKEETKEERIARLRKSVEHLESRLDMARRILADAEGRRPGEDPVQVQDPDEDGGADGVWRQVHWTWKERILHVIQRHGVPMLAKEIVPALLEAFPTCAWASDTHNTVSVVLSQLVKAGALLRIPRPGVAGAEYALPEHAEFYFPPNHR
jgi:hypothetical protein